MCFRLRAPPAMCKSAQAVLPAYDAPAPPPSPPPKTQLKRGFPDVCLHRGFRGLMHAEASDLKAPKVHQNEEENKAP